MSEEAWGEQDLQQELSWKASGESWVRANSSVCLQNLPWVRRPWAAAGGSGAVLPTLASFLGPNLGKMSHTKVDRFHCCATGVCLGSWVYIVSKLTMEWFCFLNPRAY